MKKKSIAMRLGVAAMALTLVTASMSSGTLAKYVTEETLKGNMILAQWNVSAKLVDGTKTTPTAMDAKEINFATLAKTITADAGDPSKTASQLVEDGAVSVNRIAPGMEGYFGVLVNTNNLKESKDSPTDVAVDYRITVAPAQDAELPAGFTMGLVEERKVAGDTVTWGEDIKKLSFTDTTAQELDKGTIAAGEVGDQAKKYVWIHWAWPYEGGAPATGNSVKAGNDDADTTTGQKSEAMRKYSFTVQATMVQHDPNQDMTKTYWDRT